MLDGLMQGADRDLVTIWQTMNTPCFDNIMFKIKTVSARALPDGIEVTNVPHIFAIGNIVGPTLARAQGGA